MEPLTDVRQISRIAYGYMAFQALFTALEFGLFSKLSGTSKSLQTLAGDTGMEASELLPGITSVVTAKKKGCVSTASRREGAAICRQRRQGCAGGGATICRQRRVWSGCAAFGNSAAVTPFRLFSVARCPVRAAPGHRQQVHPPQAQIVGVEIEFEAELDEPLV